MHSLTYFAQFTCMWWQAVSGIVASGFPCQAMDQILTYVHVCTYSCVWVGTHGVGTFVPHVHIVCVLLFFYFSTIPNTAEALEISSGSRMELVGGMCSWLQDHLHARINQSPASSYRHAWDTCVSAHLPVGMHVCFMCVSWWVKHLARTSRGKKANYHDAGHYHDAHSYFLFKLVPWIWA